MSTVRLDVEVRKVTDNAILVHNGKDSAWIPKSLLEDYGVRGNDIEALMDINEIWIPEWLAEERGLL